VWDFLHLHRCILIILVGVVLLSGLQGTCAQEQRSTILTAYKTEAPITIDGYPNEAAWDEATPLISTVQDGGIGVVDVELRALYDNEYIYLYASWKDPTESTSRSAWIYKNGGWSRLQEFVEGEYKEANEDRISFLWNIEGSVEGFDIAGCAMTCHGDRHRTNDLGELADAWHWKAGRTNPVGYCDDKYWNNDLTEGTDEEAIEAARHGDSMTGDDYRGNSNSEGTGPLYYEPLPSDAEDAKFITEEEVKKGEAVEITPQVSIAEGAIVPGFILHRPIGSRGDIDAKGVWRNGFWNVELKRKLSTGNPDDVEFDTSQIYRFGVAIMDNTGGFEAFGKGHSFDLGARTLEFGGIGSEEVTSLVLSRDYLTTARAHSLRQDFGLAYSDIGNALAIFNEIRDNIATIDPELYVKIRSAYTDAKRDPSLENIDHLILHTDEAILTMQGKRTPAPPTASSKIIVIWGEVQLFVFLILAILVLPAIRKTWQTSKKPAFRRMGVFLLIMITPILLEGLGRFGILAHIAVLQNFSFMTNEYAAILWAALMFTGLMSARAGFLELDRNTEMLETKAQDLEQMVEERTKKLRESEEELKRYSEDLEQMVEERTEEIRQSQQELLLLTRVNNLINAGAAEEEIFNEITRGMSSIFGYTISAIQLLTEGGDELILKSYSANKKLVNRVEDILGMSLLDYRVSLYRGSAALNLIEDKKPAITNDILSFVEGLTKKKALKKMAAPVVKMSGVRWGVGVPLIAGDRAIGIIGVGSAERLTKRDVERLSSFGSQIGLAIEKARMYENLERKVRERTEDLAKAYREVKELNRMKDELLSTVSHELKTPLTTIKGSIELLKDDVSDKGQGELLNLAENESVRLELLIEDLLALSRTPSIPKKPVRDRVSIRELFDDLFGEVQPKAKGKGLKLESDIGDFTLEGDRKLLRRALLNLINNAIKFTDKGKVAVKAWKKGGQAFISISDTGIGIEKEDQAKIFEKFYRVDTGEAKRYYGTGLGLSIVKSILDSHNGSIDVESEIGKGSTFTIRLPLEGKRG